LKAAIKKSKLALILSSGGARAAYQVGVLKSIAEIAPKAASNPFLVIGSCSGAINSTALAIYRDNFGDAVYRLQKIWCNFRVHQVFRSDVPGLLKGGFNWLLSARVGGMVKHNPASFLNRASLRKLLEKYLPCECIIS